MKTYLKIQLLSDRDQVAQFRIRSLSSCVCFTLLPDFSTSFFTCTNTSFWHMHEHKKRDLQEPWGTADCYGMVSWGWHCLGAGRIYLALLFLYVPILLIRDLLFGQAPSPCHGFCYSLTQHLALHPLTLQVHAIFLSARVVTISSIFYPALFSTGLLPSEIEVGHHPHPQVPKGQNSNLCEDHGDLGFR